MRHILSLSAVLGLAALPVRADIPAVTTDIPVTHSLVAQVMGDLGAPKLLLEQGADAHDFQLRPSQIRALQGADLVIWLGPEMTPWLDRALGGEDGDRRSLDLLHQTGTSIRDFDDAPSEAEVAQIDEAHDDDGDNPDLHEATEDEHDHSDLDPHAWLDPDNATLWIGLIADALVERDPGNAVAYRANASLALRRISELDDRLNAQLADAEGQPIVVAHDAYGYFADHFGLTIAASLAGGDAAEPGAARRSEIRRLLESGGAICIFPEAATDPDPVTLLAEETEARIGAPLDPEGRGFTPGPMLYDQVLTGLATSITDCLAGR